MNLYSFKLALVIVVGIALSVAESFAQVSAPVLDDNTYDFGLIPLGTVIHHTFTLKNSGKKALIIGKVSTSCGCTKIVSFPKQIAAGDQGDFVAVMDHLHTGYTDITIYVPTGPAAQDLYTFHLAGVLVDKAVNNTSNPAFVTAQDVVAAVATSKNVALVDVRSTNLYVQAHARGSQNVVPFALEARQDLKAKMVVLIGDGADDSSLLTRIDRLKTLGFKDVHLLAGGLRAWQMAGGGVEGAARAQSSSLAQLSGNDFYTEQRSANRWLVVNVDKTISSIPTSYPVKNIPLGSDPKVFVKKLSDALGNQAGISHVLIASSIGNGYGQIEAALRAAKLNVPVYYLQGGTLAYTAYTHEQTFLLNPQKITMDASKASLASNQASGQVVHGGGCAGCGH